VLPKIESAAQLLTIEWLVAQLERERGLTVGHIDLMPIIETGKGLAAVREIAAAGSRVRRLSFGAADYTRDMGMRWTMEENELMPARSEIVLASRVAGLEPPIDTVFVHIGKHANALRRTTQLARDLGFQGKLCIHPEQVAPINEIFTPSEAEIAHATKIVEAFKAAEASGSASIQVEGHFVDYPVVEQARRVLAITEQLRAGKQGR
jgi:citrate lyase subunit beta/citryl-CoA lyase